MHGRELWRGMQLAKDDVRLTWKIQNIFKVLNTQVAGNFLQLFCQFYAVLQRPPFEEFITRLRAPITLGKRWWAISRASMISSSAPGTTISR
eukprot:13225495-Alexandrium_andersonii.AAC.1